MAIDQTNVALDIASMAVQQATKFVDAFEELENLLTFATEAGINMVSFDAALATSGVKHVDGAIVNKLAIVIPALKAYLNTTSTGGTTYKAVFYKLRQ